jgi:hypothetical protein
MTTHPALSRVILHPRKAIVVITLLTVALSVVFFSPRLWLMREAVPGSFQWARAQTFLKQCADPFRRDIEPAMLWRVLPPLVAHHLKLPGHTPLALPWLGVLAATGYAAVILRRRCPDARVVFGGTLLLATTSAVLVPVGWLGVNDAWVWLGLLAVAFGRSAWALPVACVLCPWVDERFIIGFPLAWLVARLDRGEPLAGRALFAGLWLLPYAAVRLAVGRQDPAAGEAAAAFLQSQLQDGAKALPLVPLGWWMGLRAAWVAVIGALWAWPLRQSIFAGVVLLVTLGISALLASDFSRSAAIASPLVLAGCLALARRLPESGPRAVLAMGLANLVIPAAHVTYIHVDPISPLPLELFRLFR